MFLKPAPGITVPDPDRSDTLPADGREVEPTQYWQRRVNDGDVVQADPQVTNPTTQKES